MVSLPRTRRRYATSRLPRVRKGVVVIESDGRTCRAIVVARVRGETRVSAIEREEAPVSGETLSRLLERLRAPYRRVIVVTSEAVPCVCSDAPLSTCPSGPSRVAVGREGRASGWLVDAGSAATPRCLSTSLPRARRAWWTESLGALGRRLEGIYPLCGTALAGIRLDATRRLRLVIQVERASITLIEALGSSCHGLHIHQEPPTADRCAALIGDECPEVSLCGGGADLSALGYELVRSGRTWARLPPLHCSGDSSDGSLAAMVGAARHALGLAPADAIACVPPPVE